MSEKPTLREIIDPEGSLPDVVLTQDPDPNKLSSAAGRSQVENLVVVHDGAEVGSMTLMHANGREAWLSKVKVDIPGAGFGAAAYLAAIERSHARGETFRTQDTTQTDSAVRVWNRFIDSGIAEVIEPFKQTGVPSASGQMTHQGHIAIPPK